MVSLHNGEYMKEVEIIFPSRAESTHVAVSSHY